MPLLVVAPKASVAGKVTTPIPWRKASLRIDLGELLARYQMISFSDAWWSKFLDVARAIGARQPEDLVLVLTSETAGTLSPGRTRYSRRPFSEPQSWKDVIDWERSNPGEVGGSGALGLNTIMRPAAQALGLSAKEWWRIPDIADGDPKALDYTQAYFQYIKRLRGVMRPFTDATELYLANAAAGLLGNKLTDSTIVYSGANAQANKALMNAQGTVTVGDLAKSLRSLAVAGPGYLSAAPYLAQLRDYMGRTGTSYSLPAYGTGEAPFKRVGYSTDAPYDPSAGTDAINAANDASPARPDQKLAMEMTAAQDIPLGLDNGVLLAGGAVVALGWIWWKSRH